MLITPEIHRRRYNLRFFIDQYANHTVDGHAYKTELVLNGRDAAEALRKKIEDTLIRCAAKARCDIYGNPYEAQIPLITGVAAKVEPVNKIYYLPKPYRHHHVVQSYVYMKEVRDEKHFGEQQQGFIVEVPDADGIMIPGSKRFVNREEAMVIATNANQLNNRPHQSGKLYSEDVWAFWDSSTKEDTARDIKTMPIRTTDA